MGRVNKQKAQIMIRSIKEAQTIKIRSRFDPGVGRSLGGVNGNPLQDSCPENPTDRGAWWATVHGVTKSDTTEATEQAHTHE